MSFSQVVQLVLFSVLLAGGQIMFKMAAMSFKTIETFRDVLGLAYNAWFWGALALYGTATIIWVIILQSVPLSQAYPFVALGFIFIPLASHFIFGEVLGIYYIAGVVAIIAGLGIIATLK